MKKIKNAHIILAITIALVASIFVCCGNTYADQPSKDALYKKGLLQGYFNCANGSNSKNKRYLRDTLTTSDLTSSMYYNNASVIEWGDPYEYYLPTNKNQTFFSVWPKHKKDITNCYDLIRGNSDPSIYGVFGKTVPSGLLTDSFLTKTLGYFKNTSGGADASATTSKCFYGTYTMTITDDKTGSTAAVVTQNTYKYCVDLGGDGNAVGGTVTYGRIGGGLSYYSDIGSFATRTEGSAIWEKATDTNVVKVVGRTYNDIKNDMLPYLNNMSVTTPTTCSFSSSLKGDTYPGTCDEAVGKPYVDPGIGFIHHSYTKIFKEIEEETVSEAEATKTSFSYSLTRDGWDGWEGYRVVAALTDYDVAGMSKDKAGEMGAYAVQKAYLTNTERIQLYQWYFDGMMGANVSCSVPEETKTIYGSSGLGPIKWAVGKKIFTDCYATVNKTGQETGYHGVVAHGSFNGYYKFSSASESFDTLLQFFKDLDENTVLDSDIEKSPYADVDPTDAEAIKRAGEEAAEADRIEKEKTCYDSAGASNWIACPIIDNGTSASERMYAFIEGMLQVNTLLFTTNDGANGTFDAWGSFRNFANIAFIIVFVVVVLSQVTGFGIDNYGIKKILPKLILGALLVNISYFVCQAAVDAANITGGGLKELFKGIESGLTNNQQVHFAFGTNKVLAGITILNAANLLAGIVAAAWYFSGGGILVPILLGVIGIVIGIIFFLVLLAVRQGLAVILVVISPLAFVAYMLPNTKSLFSKWLKLLSATLLAYPICSLAVYGGQMVSTIILVGSAKAITEGLMVTNFALALTSAILSIAPVFFIPTLITKSMSGISTVANGLKARASSLGRGAFDRSHTADNMRNVAKARKDNMNTERARRTKAALEERRKANGGRLSIADRARLRTANNTIDAYEKGNESLYAGMVKDMELGTEGGTEGLYGMANEAIREHDMEKLSAVIDRMNASGNEEAAQKVLRSASAQASRMSIGELEKFKNITAQKGGSLGKAYVKALASHMSSNGGERIDFDTAMRNGAMKKAMANMGEGALAGMNKDEMSFLTENYGDSLGDLFDAKQIAAAAATHTSGKAGANFTSMLEKITAGKSTEEIQKIRNTLSAEQWAKASEQTLNAFNSKLSDGETFNAGMAQAIVDSGNGTLMSSINSELQKKLVAEANKAKAEGQKAATEYQNRVSETLNQINEQLKNKPNTP